ncbi:MAG: hypothetical protein Q4F21_03135 [Lachnospiraceae bacterium]|nr:hypothetical protein [Lachnospiraceae bacterium]
MRKAVSTKAVVIIMCICLITPLFPRVTMAADIPSPLVEAHCEGYGWLPAVTNGLTAGTEGKACQLEALKITLNDKNGNSMIQAIGHIANLGWSQGWKNSGEIIGTTGQHLPMEAIKIKLNTPYDQQYDILYRTHISNWGWTDWCRNGEVSGSVGMAIQAEAVQVKLVTKNSVEENQQGSVGSLTKPILTSSAHCSDLGWLSTVGEGEICGTTGRALQLESLIINLKDFSGANGVQYRVHVRDIGTMGWCSSGQAAGTTGRRLSIESIEIKLNQMLANYYDIYYRIHSSNYGWLGWAKNGQPAGTSGGAVPAEAIEIKLVRKTSPAPGGGTAYYDLTINKPSAPMISEEKNDYVQKVATFINDSRWRNGAYYGGSRRPYISSYNGIGCCAYAADFIKYVYSYDSFGRGIAYNNPSEIRTGDVLKVVNSQHWIVVLSRNGDSLRTAEGNWTNGTVCISDTAYKVKNSTLYRNGYRFRTFSVGYHFR